jgi:predicted PurR-regulated permease PerM
MTGPELANPGSRPRTGILVLAIAIAAILPAVCWMAKPFLTAGILAAILAVALDPLHSRTVRVVRRPSFAALITTSVAVGPGLIALMLGGMAVNRGIKSGVLAEMLKTSERLTGRTSFDVHTIQGALPELNRVAGGLVTCAFAAVFLYVFLVNGKAWITQLMSALPIDASVSERILTAIRDAVVANVDGILAMAVAEAMLFGTIFQIAGITSAAMWGALAGLSSMIPLLGAAAVWLPLTIRFAIQGFWIKAAMTGMVCLAVQQVVALLLVPRLIGTRLRQSPLLIALSILGAASAFGVLGILVGPVIISVLGVLVQELRIQLQKDALPEAKTRQ